MIKQKPYYDFNSTWELFESVKEVIGETELLENLFRYIGLAEGTAALISIATDFDLWDYEGED